MDRHWLLTWTTYGQWLPGGRRGFVGSIRQGDGEKEIHNVPGTEYDCDIPALYHAMRASMRGEPVWLNAEHSEWIQKQFQETAQFRGWAILAGAIMANHIHLVVGVCDDPEPETILHSFKSYASRVLNRQFGKPVNGTWWTESGSRRKLPDDKAIEAAVRYVLQQERPLLVWSASGACQRPGESVNPASGACQRPGESPGESVEKSPGS